MKIDIPFFDHIKQNALHRNKVIFSDPFREYTSADFDELSGRVYAYLSHRHIGTEDVVIIHTKRSALVFVCLLGIFKAGACSAMVADWTDEKHFEFYKNDCHPKLIITDDVLAEMLQYPTKEGHATPDEHDAAFICYTSSSTGSPKGAVHEYGDFLRVDDYVWEENADFDLSTVRYLNTAYLYDIGSIQLFLTYASCNAFVRIPESNLMKNPEALIEEANRYQINFFSAMPQFFSNDFILKIKSLKGVEFAYSTVENVYDDRVTFLNCYGTSESVIPLTREFEIDKPYEITPVGKPTASRPLYLVDEDDRPVPHGEIGEIAFENPYFRGYLNHPDETKKVLKNGLYHTGDVGRWLDDGNLLVLDRKVNTVRTDKGLIVSNLIKVKLKTIWNNRFVHVVSMKRSGQLKIVAFYDGDTAVDAAETNCQLSRMLPDYMLPTDYVRLDAVPYLTSGKLNLRQLMNKAEALFEISPSDGIKTE